MKQHALKLSLNPFIGRAWFSLFGDRGAKLAQ